MKYFVEVNGKKYEVIVEKAGSSTATAAVSPKAAEAPAPAVKKPVDATPKTTVPAGEEAIKCPMPGTILSVKVKEGQAVNKGTILFILEAMKMENEIMAPRDCTVVKIAVADGASVKTADLLAVIK